MILPIGKQRAQQIRPAQHRRIRRRFRANDDVIAAAGTGVAAVEHELLRAEPRLPRFLVEDLGVLHQFAPAGRRMDVDFDDARIGSDLQPYEPRIARRIVAFEDDR